MKTLKLSKCDRCEGHYSHVVFNENTDSVLCEGCNFILEAGVLSYVD